ncbi:Uncharacterised protein [Elizabethkingia anophelis]|nr:Uncharacterised protein [Elizabethkingia anophelis]
MSVEKQSDFMGINLPFYPLFLMKDFKNEKKHDIC